MEPVARSGQLEPGARSLSWGLGLSLLAKSCSFAVNPRAGVGNLIGGHD